MNTTNTFNSNNPRGWSARESPVLGPQLKEFLGALSPYVRLYKSLLLLVFLTGIIACANDSPFMPKTDRSATNIIIEQGKDFTIPMDTLATNGRMTATVYPTNHTNGSVIWISSHPQYITIDSNTGIYNAVAVGDAIIAARVGKALATIEVKIVNPQPQYITTNFNVFVTITNGSTRFFSNVVVNYINVIGNYLKVPYTTNGYATIWLSNIINQRLININEISIIPYKIESFSTTNIFVVQSYIETNTEARPSAVSNFFPTNTENVLVTNIDLTNDDPIYFHSSNLIVTTVLSGLNLSSRNLSYLNLENFELDGANLSNTDLRYANLKYANLSGADLTGAKHNNNHLGYFNLTSDNDYSRGLTYYDNAFWVVDNLDDKVYKYSTTGAYQSSFNLSSDNVSPLGLTYYDNAFWVVDNSDDKVYKYSTTGTYQSSFNLSSDNGSPLGLTYYDNAFWVVDNSDDKVYKYSTTGAYQSSFNLSSDNGYPRGITYYDNALWVVDSYDDKVYKYTTTGTYQSSFDLNSANDDPYGLTYYNNAFWVGDRRDNRLYSYLALVTGKSDVLISDVSVSDNGVFAGQSFTLSVVVSNWGTGPAGPTTLTYYRSTDNIIDTLDTPLNTASVPSLSRGAFSSHSISVIFPINSEYNYPYYYGACVSVTSGETSTANKCYQGVRVKNTGDFNLTSSNGSPYGITYHDNAFWVVDIIDDKVYKYSTNGTYQSRFDLRSGNSTPRGIAYYDNALWVVDNGDKRVYKYSTTGTYQSRFDLRRGSGNNAPRGIAYYDNALWVVDNDSKRVFKYSTTGTYQSRFDLRSDNGSPLGLTYYDNAFWVVDNLDDKVYKYSTTGTYQSSFNLSSDNGYPRGITYYDNALWVVDSYDKKVYWYPVEGDNEEPDIVISDVSVSDSILPPGQSSTLSVRINNSGTGDAGSVTLTYYRSTDSIIGTLDTQLNTAPVLSLNRGASSAHSISVTSPNSGDSYYYGVCVSVATGETSTANKCSPGVLVKTNGEFNLTSENQTPRGIVYHDGALWVVDKYDDKVYKYTITGNYLSSFDLHNANTAPVGITYGENAFWVANDNNDKVYKYSTTWEYQSSFDITGAARGIVYTGTDLWVVDTDSDKVYIYSTAGEYQSSFDLDDVNASPYGIVLGKGSYWVGDNNDDKLYKYSTTGEYQSSFDISSDNTDPRGVAYYDNALWVVDWEDDKVYWYPLD